MKLKLFKKYFFTTAVIIAVSLAGMLVILSFVLNNYFAKTKSQTLNQCCNEVSSYSKELEEGTIKGAHFVKAINALSTVSGVNIFITDNNGKIQICGCEEWSHYGKCYHSERTVPKEKLENNYGENLHKLDTLDIYTRPHYVASKAITMADGKRIGTVFSTAPVEAVRQLLSSVTRLYIFSAVIPLVVMFFAIYVMTYRLTKPLKLMSNASRAMARGDFSKRIPVTTDDEIGELAVSFNQMTNSLAQLEGMRKSFVANVSHELKTPMTTIGGFIDGILDGTIEPERQSYYLNIVSEEVKRLSRLVQSMLSMSKLESGEFAIKAEVFDFRELLCNIVISQEQRIENKGFEITGLDEIPAVSINADKDLIYQAIYNLVDNAIKFTDDGGTIDFKVKTENKRLIFKINNTGTGIPIKELPYLFERFYKIDKSRSDNKNSTGLGLYIVKTIVKAHGGTVTVESEEDKYTSFIVTLPIL